MKYANQRSIRTNRDMPAKNSRRTYLTIHDDNLYAAMKDLSGVAFKLYCYLANNKNGYVYDLSIQHFRDISGAGSTSAHEAFNTLVQKGYLVEYKKNCYDFYEVPYIPASSQTLQQDKQNIPALDEKRLFTHISTGETEVLTYNQVLQISNNDEALALQRWNKGKLINDFGF